jgi:heptosyltransferase III
MEHTRKILAIKFKYLGDVALAVPAWRALKQACPKSELHLLVAHDAVPLVANLPWVARVWGFPRHRGRASLKQSWPLLAKLRREKFDRSVDFTGNDRGAIISLLCGARQRLGLLAPRGFWGRRFCYSQRVSEASLDLHETLRDLHILSAWHIPTPDNLESEIHTAPAWDRQAEPLLPAQSIVCHISTSQPKKEWPLPNWSALYHIASQSGLSLVFSSGPTEREQQLLQQLKCLIPHASTLPPTGGLETFLAVLKRARLIISGDTGPLHFASALGVPTISIFGPSRRIQFAPLGERHQSLEGSPCQCSCHASICSSSNPCISGVLPSQVWQAIQNALHSPHKYCPTPFTHQVPPDS